MQAMLTMRSVHLIEGTLFLFHQRASQALWGVYGEYLYIPPQRWVHNLEVGEFC